MELLQIETSDLQAAISFVSVIAFFWLLIEFKGMKEALKEKLNLDDSALKLKLQAYERLTVFADRTSLKNVVARNIVGSESLVATHAIMVNQIREEFDYNVSQQIYVAPEIWEAIVKLKDQNIYIINQLYAGLPPEASGTDLCKRILEYNVMQTAELSNVVMDAIQFEAKKLL